MAVIRARQLTVLRGTRELLRSVDLDVAMGERVALVGANGAGKTSLLLTLVGALEARGKLAVTGELLGPATIEAIRARTGFVFAEPADQLFCETVAEELAFGLRARSLPEQIVDESVARALGELGMGELAERSPRELSLGEQRRLAIAAVLITGPELLLLDEPTASLDPRARRALLRQLAALGTTTLLATHDLDAVLELGARTLILSEGRIAADGPAAELLADEALLEATGLALPLTIAARRTR